MIRIESVLPKSVLREGPIRAELLREMNRQIDIIDRMYAKTYSTWTHKPVFKKKIATSANKLEVGTSTDNKIMLFLDDGTKERYIYPRRARVLLFRTGFRPKTNVRTIGSRRGSQSGPLVGAKRVKHKIRARKWTDEIVKRRQKHYATGMARALALGVKRFA